MSRTWPVLILLSCVATAPAQETPLPLPEEAPESLFQTTIGSSDVEMFLDGSWRAGVAGATGFLVRSGEGIQPLDLFPALPLGFEFSQEPELTFAVWLRRHYFVEYTVLGSFDENAFRAGYEGDGTLRSLVVGNRGIGIDPYPYLEVPETGDSSLGAEATLASGNSRHEILLRYDNNSGGRKVFVGQNAVEEVRIPLSSYEQGMRLRLPDAQVQGLRLYLEDPDGTLIASDERRYRMATAADAIADEETGIVTLKARPAGRVLVHYTKGALTVGDVGLGIDSIATVSAATGAVDPATPRTFDSTQALWVSPDTGVGADLLLTIEGRTALLLHSRGAFSLFDMQGTYLPGTSLPAEAWRVNARLVERGTYETRGAKPQARLRVDPQLSRVVASLLDDPRDLENLYPLLEEDATRARLYGPFRDDSDGLYDREILVETLTPVSGYFLEPDILSGSVSVTRNGTPETRFTVDAGTGQVTFLTPIGATDRLEITYKKKGALLDNGDLVLAWGNRFALREPFVADLAAGFRWNALPGAYSEKPFTRTGAVLVSGGVSGSLDNFSLDAQTAVSYAHPDTTGRLRLAGMEASGLEVPLDENVALPASAPDPGGLADQSSRGRLLYKDYRDYGLLGTSTLRGPEWSPPPDQVYPYESGSRPGPYNVAGGSSDDADKSLVLDFALDAGEWAGFQIPVLPGQPLTDLSSLEALITSYRMLELTGTVEVAIEIGDVAEDVDYDNKLDEESSASATGFRFDDSGNGVWLLVGGGPKGQGNGRIDTEDLDGDEHLQRDDGSFVQDAFAAAAGGWQVRRDIFDSADRRLLRRARAVRVFVRETAAATATGRLLLDRLSLAGSTFAVIESTDTTVAAREVAERFAQQAPPRTLEEEFEDVVQDIFHASGQVQKVLEIQWNGSGAADDWTVRGFTSAGTEGARYREVVHYLRAPVVPPGSTLEFQLLDSQDQGITWSFAPGAFADWREVRVDIEKKQLQIDGAAPPGASVSVDRHESLVQFRVRCRGGDGSAGLLYVDELHMASPLGSVGAAVFVDARLSVPGPIVRLGSFPLVSDLQVREIARATTPGFSPLYGRPAEAWGGSSRTEVAMSLPASRLDAHLAVDWADADVTLGGGHALVASVGPLSFTDSFELRAPGPDATFDRETRVRLSLARWATADASAGASAADDRLTQEWSGGFTGAAGRWSGSLVADFGLTTLDYEHAEGGYFDAWLLGYRFVGPARAALLERASRAATELALRPQPVGFTLQLEPSVESLPSSGGREQRDTLKARLAVPLSIDGRGATVLTAAYQRRLETSTTLADEGAFLADWSRLAGDLGDQSYLCSAAPFWELYSDGDAFRSASAAVTSALYEPEIQAEITRMPGSRILALFVPTRMLAVVGRSLQKEGALYSDLNRYELTYQTNAINLFGRVGAHPVFPFYDLDEIANSAAVAIKVDRGGSLENADLRLDSLVGLEKIGGSRLTLSNRFAVTGRNLDELENRTQASYTWFVRPAGGVRLPLLDAEITRGAFFVHDESLELTAAWGSHPFTGLVRHRSEIRIPEHGHVAATLAVGADFESFRGSDGRESLVRLVVQAGIEALIRFGSGEPKRTADPAPRDAGPGRPP